MPRRAARHALVLLGYAAVSFGYFGWRLLPHPGRVLVGSGQDPLIFVWSFAWWPHALGTWTNPFVSHAIYAPQGINLAWTASAPGLALAFSPVTVLFGPVVAYNVAAVLLPALAAWTAYLLCLHVTRLLWASLVGGYLFGFSSYVLGQQLQGHLHLTGAFVLPLVALVVVRYVGAELDARGLAWRLAVLLAVQLAISTETALTLTIALALALLLAFALVPGVRARVRSSLLPIAASYALAAVLAAPLVVFVVRGFRHESFTGAEAAGTDLLNTVLPTGVNGVLGSSFRAYATHFNETESAVFLGLPALVVIALFAWRRGRSPEARFLLTAAAVSLVVALGAKLRVDGRELVPLPWAAARHVPTLNNVHVARFGVYLALAGAVIVALWTARTSGRVYSRPYLLPALCVAALVPSVTHPSYRSQPDRWPFFTQRMDESCFPKGETLLVFPFGFQGDSMLWQAERGFRFRLAEGYMYPLVHGTTPPTEFDRDPTVNALTFETATRLPTTDRLLAFVATHDVDRVLSVRAYGYPTARALRRFGPVDARGGVLVAPGCGRPSLRTRDLTPFVREQEEQIRADRQIGWCLGTNFYTLPEGFVPAGVLAGATRAPFVAGRGLACAIPPGYRRQGFATAELGVPPDTYPLYVPRRGTTP